MVIFGEGINLGVLSNDSRGFAISLDLLLALIPITLLLGFVAADMDNILFQIEDTVFRSSMDRTAGDALNTLVATSGDPNNWENTGNPSIVGLAQYDTSKGAPDEGMLDPVKLGSVTEGQVQGLVGNNYNFYLNITTINKTGTRQVVKTLGNSSFGNAKDVVKVERIVQASNFKVVSSLIGQIRYTGGTRSFNIPSFPTSFNSNQTFDYWILIANNAGFTGATVSVNNFAINFTSANINNPALINSAFLKLNASNPTLFTNNTISMNGTGSFPSSMDIYIVQTPKGTNAADINTNTVVPKNCTFDFYLWLK
jgi:hypothetical protein